MCVLKFETINVYGHKCCCYCGVGSLKHINISARTYCGVIFFFIGNFQLFFYTFNDAGNEPRSL